MNLNLLKELRYITENNNEARFMDLVWKELSNKGIEEVNIERAFSGKGLSRRIEDYYQGITQELSDKELINKKMAQSVADKLIKKFSKVLKR